MICKVKFYSVFDTEKFIFNKEMIIEVLLMLKKRRKLQLIKLFKVQNEPVSDHFIDHVIILYRNIIIIKYDVRIGTKLNCFWKSTYFLFIVILVKIFSIIVCVCINIVKSIRIG